MRDLVHRDKELFALIYRSDIQNDKLAIFVHGFHGNYLTTWGGLSDQLFVGADSRPTFCDWDYVFLGYKTSDVATYLDIAQLIWDQWRKADRGDPPYKHRYNKLALLGHSLGTLGIRQAVCASSYHPSNILRALH